MKLACLENEKKIKETPESKNETRWSHYSLRNLVEEMIYAHLLLSLCTFLVFFFYRLIYIWFIYRKIKNKQKCAKKMKKMYENHFLVIISWLKSLFYSSLTMYENENKWVWFTLLSLLTSKECINYVDSINLKNDGIPLRLFVLYPLLVILIFLILHSFIWPILCQ